jgi:hypothetical protein
MIYCIHKIDPGTGHNEIFDRCFDIVFENGQITYSVGFIGNRTPFNTQYRAHGQLARALHRVPWNPAGTPLQPLPLQLSHPI